MYIYMCHAVAIVQINFEERFEFTALVVFGRTVLLNIDIYAAQSDLLVKRTTTRLFITWELHLEQMWYQTSVDKIDIESFLYSFIYFTNMVDSNMSFSSINGC